MKRTVPLIITAAGGFTLIVAFFIPATESWGEVAAIWFDILAAIAFILGGGNLVRNHLKKISDQTAGWAYSVITLAAFFITLTVGLLKVGARPMEQQEYYGQRFASLSLEDFPLEFSVEGTIPPKKSGRRLPDSVHGQLVADAAAGTISFRGWMEPNQLDDLKNYKHLLEWQATVEALYDKAQPPEPLRGKAFYHAGHRALAFAGRMSEFEYHTLRELAGTPEWLAAVDALYEATNQTAEIECPADALPERFDAAAISPDLSYDEELQRLRFTGPMPLGLRDRMVRRFFPVATPLSPAAEQVLVNLLKQAGPLSEAQIEALSKAAAAGWTFDQLIAEVNRAGEPVQVPKTAREMLAEKQAGATVIEPMKTVGEKRTLNNLQQKFLREFDSSEMTVDDLVEGLRRMGPLSARQVAALRAFLAKQPTAAERNKELGFALLRAGPLTEEQRDLMFGDYRKQIRWRRYVGRLFAAAHVVKFPWSGEYRAIGTPFWWLYEYAFKPLTATMFAMLAFYVASAAFRAFRAKNLEAVLLLGTAFIILLGRTFAGVYLTSWLPEPLSFLRIEELTIRIMQWFNTAGNRAIMIGIALGIASTSLKVLLAVDRSYLGTGGD